MILPSYSCLLHDPRPLHLASSGPQPSLWLFWSLTEAQVLCVWTSEYLINAQQWWGRGFWRRRKNGERETEQGTRQDSVKQLSSTELTLHPPSLMESPSASPQTQTFGYLSFRGKRMLAEFDAYLKTWQCLSREHPSSELSPRGVSCLQRAQRALSDCPLI